MKKLFTFCLCMIFVMTAISCSKSVGASLAKNAIELIGKRVPDKGYYKDRYGTNTYYSIDFSDFTAPMRSYIALFSEDSVIVETFVDITSEDEAVARKEHDEVLAYLTKNGWVYHCEIPVGYLVNTYYRNKKGDLFVRMGEFDVASNASGSMFVFSAEDPSGTVAQNSVVPDKEVVVASNLPGMQVPPSYHRRDPVTYMSVNPDELPDIFDEEIVTVYVVNGIVSVSMLSFTSDRDTSNKWLIDSIDELESIGWVYDQAESDSSQFIYKKGDLYCAAGLQQRGIVSWIGLLMFGTMEDLILFNR